MIGGYEWLLFDVFFDVGLFVVLVNFCNFCVFVKGLGIFVKIDVIDVCVFVKFV